MKKTTTLFALLVTLVATPLFSQGGLDKTFASTGKIVRSITPGFDFTTATAVQTDGKILVTGYVSNGSVDFMLLRFNMNGTLDTAFGDSGTVISDFGKSEIAMAMVLQPDGKIILAGQANPVSNADFALARYNTDGSLDATFGNGGMATAAIGQYDDIAQAITLQSDGRIVVAGYSGAYPNYDFSLARFKANGIIDSSFSSDGRIIMPIGTGSDIATAVKIQANGKIVVAGRFVAKGEYDIAVVRLHPDGSLDFDFGSTGVIRTSIGSVDDMGSAIAIQPDQKIIVGGSANTGSYSDFAIVRYDTAGALDNSFSGDGKQTIAIGSDNDGANAMALQPDGKIMLGGFAKIGMYNQFALARVDADGTIDSTFGHHGKTSFAMGNNNDMVLAMALQSDGKIIAAGFSNNGSNYDLALARYIPGSEVGISMTGKNSLSANAWPNPASSQVNLVYHLAQASEVNIQILDLQGKLVYTLPGTGLQQAGIYDSAFALPESLTAGVYFIKITSISGTAILKLTKA